MSQKIKIWKIAEKDSLQPIDESKLNMEKRIETWIEKDISTISNDLLIIGRQVATEFGGFIDLLCLDHNGDIVIIELKRDKTPREITAQLLDYASWVKNLSNERINDIANEYLKNKGPLDKTFKEKFNQEIPDILNENHKMLVVASETDDSSERIIEYLSDTYGVGINAVTFQYFQNDKEEFLARVFLIEPDKADYRAQTKTASKRRKEKWTEETLFEEAKNKFSSQELIAFQKIYEFSKNIADDVHLGTGALYGSFNPIWFKISPRSIYSLGTNGCLSFNFDWIGDKEFCKIYMELLQKAGFKIPEKIAQEGFIRRPSVTADEWAPRANEFIEIIRKLTNK